MRDLILRPATACLARRLTGLRDDGGRGAIGVLVAVLIGAGVLFGMGALVVDVGQLYQNRAELQNGADAAALAVAKSCAKGNCDPSVATATVYADDNASGLTGGKANVNSVCGVNGAAVLGSGTCPVAVKSACPANPPTGANYVDVVTSTLLPSGSTVLPPVFAGTLTGSHSGSTVVACAQAQWGAPLSATTVGFTISACTWDAATGRAVGQPPGQVTKFAPPPPYPPNPAASFDQVVYLKGGPAGNGCPTEPAGAAAPGNFGWTSDASNTCTTFISGGIYGGNTGNSVSGDCQTVIAADQANRTVIEVPVYESVSGTGANVTYSMVSGGGFAAFVITGYKLPSMSATDWVTGQVPCSGGSSCISGFFTHDLVDSPGSLGGVNLGADIIKLTG